MLPAVGRRARVRRPAADGSCRGARRRGASPTSRRAWTWSFRSAAWTSCCRDARPHGSGFVAETPEDRRRAREAMRACDVEALAERDASALSGGERRRVFLARALAQEARGLAPRRADVGARPAPPARVPGDPLARPPGAPDDGPPRHARDRAGRRPGDRGPAAQGGPHDRPGGARRGADRREPRPGLRHAVRAARGQVRGLERGPAVGARRALSRSKPDRSGPAGPHFRADPATMRSLFHVVQERPSAEGAPGRAAEQGPGGALGQVRQLPADPLQQGARPELQDLPEVRLPLPALGARAPADAVRRRASTSSSTRTCAPRIR